MKVSLKLKEDFGLEIKKKDNKVRNNSLRILFK